MTPDTHRLSPVKRPVVRRPGMALASIGLVALSIAVFSTLYERASSPGQMVLGVRRLVQLGQQIEASDLTEVRVRVGTAIDWVPASREDEVVGKRAAVALLPGTLLASQGITSSAVPADGVALVGVGLRPDQAPASGVAAGDRVDAVLTGGTGNALALGAPSPLSSANSVPVGGPGSVLAIGAIVVDVASAGTGPANNASVSVVTLEVPRAEAPLLAAASTAGEVALVIVGPQP